MAAGAQRPIGPVSPVGLAGTPAPAAAPVTAGAALERARRLPAAAAVGAAAHAAPSLPLPRLALLVWALALALSACSTPASRPGRPAPAGKAVRSAAARPADTPLAWRLTLQTRRSGWPPPDLARHVGQTTGLPVRHLSAAAPQWQIVELRCPGEPDCRRAVKQLRQDEAFGVVEVERPPAPVARAAR